MEDRDHVEAGRSSARLASGGVLGGRLVRLEAEADLSQVSSSVVSDRSSRRSIRMITRSSGSGQLTRLSCSSQSTAGSRRCLAGMQREHRLEGVQAEMLPVGDPHAAGFGDLEVVADLEAADRTPLDSLHGDANVVEAHLGHRAKPLCPRLRGACTPVSVARRGGVDCKGGVEARKLRGAAVAGVAMLAFTVAVSVGSASDSRSAAHQELRVHAPDRRRPAVHGRPGGDGVNLDRAVKQAIVLQNQR